MHFTATGMYNMNFNKHESLKTMHNYKEIKSDKKKIDRQFWSVFEKNCFQ